MKRSILAAIVAALLLFAPPALAQYGVGLYPGLAQCQGAMGMGGQGMNGQQGARGWSDDDAVEELAQLREDKAEKKRSLREARRDQQRARGDVEASIQSRWAETFFQHMDNAMTCCSSLNQTACGDPNAANLEFLRVCRNGGEIDRSACANPAFVSGAGTDRATCARSLPRYAALAKKVARLETELDRLETQIAETRERQREDRRDAAREAREGGLEAGCAECARAGRGRGGAAGGAAGPSLAQSLTGGAVALAGIGVAYAAQRDLTRQNTALGYPTYSSFPQTAALFGGAAAAGAVSGGAFACPGSTFGGGGALSPAMLGAYGAGGGYPFGAGASSMGYGYGGNGLGYGASSVSPYAYQAYLASRGIQASYGAAAGGFLPYSTSSLTGSYAAGSLGTTTALGAGGFAPSTGSGTSLAYGAAGTSVFSTALNGYPSISYDRYNPLAAYTTRYY